MVRRVSLTLVDTWGRFPQWIFISELKNRNWSAGLIRFFVFTWLTWIKRVFLDFRRIYVFPDEVFFQGSIFKLRLKLMNLKIFPRNGEDNFI